MKLKKNVAGKKQKSKRKDIILKTDSLLAVK